MTTRVYTEPRFNFAEDHGEGGIKQVIGHVIPYLEARDCVFVERPEDADVVWYHATPYATTRVYLESRPGIAVVCSNHGLYWESYNWDESSLAANAEVIDGLRLADVVTVPSQWVANALHRGIIADIRVVPHGIDLAEFAPPETPGNYLLFDKTRVDPVCDPSPVFALAQRMPDQKVVMTGEPTTDLPNILKLGRIPYEDARELARNAGLYLCVTRETFGLATLQAMAAGVPVVGYRYGGQAEICPTEAEGAILVPPGDVDALAVAVQRALSGRYELGKAARARAAEYTWERAASLYYRAFEDAIAAHASPVRVTVITTAYNAQATIARTIRSARAAMGADDEYIVVDDASTDGTRRAAVEAIDLDPRVVFVARETNGYLAQARNDALRLARGRYVTCLDADDELPPDALDALAGELDKDRTTQIGYGKVFFIDDFPQPNGTIEEHPAEYGFGPGRSQWPFPFDWETQAQGTNVTCMPYASMIRTAWLKRAGGWRTRCRTGEDIDLWQRLVTGGARPRMVTEADTLIYHTSTTSMSIANRLPDWGSWYPWTGAAGRRVTPPFGVPFAPPASTGWRAWPVSHHAEPRVTVVIPVGPGHERYVLDALDSVAAQTYRRWECIVVPDTPGEFPTMPGWVRVADGRASRGVAAARNAGWRSGTAPYVVFLDADDYLDADALEHLVETIDRHPELAVVYPDYWERIGSTSQGRTTYEYRPHPLPDWDCNEAEKPGAVYAVTAIYRRDALEAVGGFDEAAPGWEDGALQVALAYAGRCAARLARRLFVYTLDSGGRRADNLAREPEIVEWFRHKYEGVAKVACNSCGGGPARVSSPVMGDGGDAVVLSGGMTAVQYTGALGGSFSVRGGQSGAFYTFGAGREARKAVLNEDLGYFEASPEYAVERDGSPQAPDAKPRLQIDGPPSGVRAAVA